MVKKGIFLVLLSCFFMQLHGVVLNEKIKNIIGHNNYITHNSLINHLFKNEYNFLHGEQIKYYNLFKTLQKNGLLDLRLQKRGSIELKFRIIDNKRKGYKILNDTLETLGYKYFFTKVFENSEHYLQWDITFSAEYSMDPVIFIRELMQNGAKVTNVEKIDQRSWSYEIDFTNAYLEKSIKIGMNERVNFRKLLKPLLLRVNNIKSLEISSHGLNRWYPKVVFYDKNLNVLGTVKYDRYQKRIKLDAPQDASYIKITDLYNLINTKRGLTIIVR